MVDARPIIGIQLINSMTVICVLYATGTGLNNVADAAGNCTSLSLTCILKGKLTENSNNRSHSVLGGKSYILFLGLKLLLFKVIVGARNTVLANRLILSSQSYGMTVKVDNHISILGDYYSGSFITTGLFIVCVGFAVFFDSSGSDISLYTSISNIIFSDTSIVKCRDFDITAELNLQRSVCGNFACERLFVRILNRRMEFSIGRDSSIRSLCCKHTGGRNHNRCNEHYGDEQRHYLADFSCLHNYHLSFDFCTGLVRMAYGAFSCPFLFFRSGVIGAAATAKASVPAKRGHLSAYLYHYTVTLFYSRFFCLSTEKFKFYI